MADNQKQLASTGEEKSRWGLARLFIASILCLHVFFFFNAWQRIKGGYPDFIVYYTAATILRDGLGHQLYVERVQSDVQKRFSRQLPTPLRPLPYIHLPAEALIFVPLTQLSFRWAFLAWDLLNLAILFGIGLSLRPNVSILRLTPPWEFVIASLAFFPVFECLLQGQDSILQLLFCVLAWKALEKEADVTAGCWFALGAFKFQFMLPIVLLITIWKRRRVLIGFAAVSGILALISVGLVGWKSILQYPTFVLQIANSPILSGVSPDFLPNLHGLLMGWPLHLSGAVGTATAVVTSIGLFVFAATRGQKAVDPRSSPLKVLLAIAVADLIGWQTNAHDFSLLILPVVLIADYCLRKPRQSPDRFALLYPASPLFISPLWLVLLLAIGCMNLMAIPLLWWVWTVGEELSQSTHIRSIQP